MDELDNPVPPAKIIDDKSILDLIETSLYQYMSSEEYDCWENCPLYGVCPDEYDYYPVCKKDMYDFFRELYNVFSHNEDYKTLDLIEEWWSDEDIDLIKTEISDLPYYDELDEKAKKNGFSSYQEILDSPYFDKEWDKQMKQINEYFIQDLKYACRKLPYKVLDIGHSKNDEEINIYISTKDNQYENYDDFIVNWFMNANTNEYKEVLEEIFDNIYDAEDVVGIMHEFLFDVINRIKNNPDQLSFKL